MDATELVTVLREAGLSPYQADAYVALLDLGSASASDLADASGVPGPRIYDVLRDLEDAGYVATYDQDRMYARALDPSDALGEIRSRVGRFERAIEEVESRWQPAASPEREVALVRRFRTVFDRTTEYIEAADHYVQLSLTPGQFGALQPALRDAHSRGVYIHALVHTPPDGEFPFESSDFEGVCTEARRTAPCWAKPFAALIDHRKVSFALYVDSPDEYGLLVDDPIHENVFWFYLVGLWEVGRVVYATSEIRFPVVFLEVRECIRFVEPLLEDGAAVSVRVRGWRTRTDRPIEFSGRAIEVRYADEPTSDGPASLFQLADLATLVVETDAETYTVGGYGAAVEDVRADRITVESVRENDAPE